LSKICSQASNFQEIFNSKVKKYKLHIISPTCFGVLTANILYFHKFVKIEAEITLLHIVLILPHIAAEFRGFYRGFGRF